MNDVQEGQIISVRIIGQRFELNDKMVSIIGELVKEKDFNAKPKPKPRLIY